MTYLFDKLKRVGFGVLALVFVMSVAVSSCGSKSESSEESGTVDTQEQPAATENAMDTTKMEEHPAGEEEHPAGEEEHPADSTADEGEGSSS